ncbi:MAG: CUAEP/CCAEP-tail radical SAM (seleno)protein [Actinomycetota bacterium]
MKVVLVSTYELGRQPFGLASPAAWLERAGTTVTCLDLAVQSLEADTITAADLIAFYVPMHTATRLAVQVFRKVRAINLGAHYCFYGLYAPMNERFLRKLGAHSIIGGEFEAPLVALVKRLSEGGETLAHETVVSLDRQKFVTPDRSGLPPLEEYAHLHAGPGDIRKVGYTEATRGCKHLCSHCPVVPVYGGKFRVVSRDVVLEDVAQQVKAGARHITFGDPDFLNAPRHAVEVTKSLHGRWPALTYDVTIKIEHLLKHAGLVPQLKETGCLFVTSAVESVDDRVLAIFDKRHSKEDFGRAASLFKDVGLTLNPTFVAFTPWISLEGYVDLLSAIWDLDLVANVSPVQYGIRLLIPEGSRLLELEEVQDIVGDFDEAALCWTWAHEDPRVDRLQQRVMDFVANSDAGRHEIFEQVWALAGGLEQDPARLGVARRGAGSAGSQNSVYRSQEGVQERATIPYLTEPWYC